MTFRHRGEFEVLKGLGLPRYTTAQRLAYVPPEAGYLVHDVGEKAIYQWDGAQWTIVQNFKFPWKPKEQWIKPAGTIPQTVVWGSSHIWSPTDDLIASNTLSDAVVAGTVAPLSIGNFQNIAGLDVLFASTGGNSNSLNSGNIRLQPGGPFAAANSEIDFTFNQSFLFGPTMRVAANRAGVNQIILKGGATWNIIAVVTDIGPAVVTGDGTDTITIDTNGLPPHPSFVADLSIAGNSTGFTLRKLAGNTNNFNSLQLQNVLIGVPTAADENYTVQRYVDGTLVAANNADMTDYFFDLTGLYQDIPQEKQIINSPAHGLVLPAAGFIPLGVGAVPAQDDVVDTAFYAVSFPDANNIEIVSNGVIEVFGHGLAVGQYYYADATTPGALTSVPPRSDSFAIAIAPSLDKIVLSDTGFEADNDPVTAILTDNLVAFVANNTALTAGNHDRADVTSGAVANDTVTLPANAGIGTFGQLYNDTGFDLLLAKDAGDAYLGAPDTIIPADTLVSWRFVANNVVEVSSVRPARVYGSEFFSASDDAVSTTTSNTFQNKLTLNLNCLGGTYEVSWTYGWNHDDAANDFEGQLLLDAVAFGEIHKQEPKDQAGTFATTGSAQRMYFAHQREVVLAAGAHALDLEYRTDTGGVESSIWQARIKVLRVA